MPAGSPLQRVVTLPAAVGLGLGSIVGTGAFATLGLGAAWAGPWLLVALLLAALVALGNALSSAQLAAVHPVSGGTYAYAHRFLGPGWAAAAGWLFLLAKTASCAAATLALGGLVAWVRGQPGDPVVMRLAGMGSLLVVTAWALGGMRLSARANAGLVAVAMLALLTLGLASLEAAWRGWSGLSWSSVGSRSITPAGVLRAAALAFVAFAGYARITTLGEEVRQPERTIPRAVVLTLLAALVLYAMVAAVGLGVLGPEAFSALAGEQAAPLLAVAHRLETPWLHGLLVVGSACALVAVQLNLVLGLSRVALAAGRHGDLPAVVSRTTPLGVPAWAIAGSAGAVGLVVLIGRVPTAWSLSAAAVLAYYAITNLAAMRLAEGRFVPRWVHVASLVGCLLLGMFLPAGALAAVGALVVAVLAIRRVLASGRA